MYIAYYEENDYHTEIMGLFLDFCVKNNVNFDLFNNKDQSYFLEHFQIIFKPLKINRFKVEELRDMIDNYDYIIIGTMGSSNLINDLILLYPKKFIQIFHNEDNLKKINSSVNSNSARRITLTPLNEKIGLYLLPIFDYNYNNRVDAMNNNINRAKDKIITMVGRFTNHRSYTSLLPLLNFDYTIWIIARKNKFVPQSLVSLSQTNPKLKISYKLNAIKMTEILTKSRYILCAAEKDSWYYKDRLTGTIPLSYNYNVPVIIPSSLNKIYKIKGSVEYETPENIPDNIKAIDNNPGMYESILDSLIEQKREIVSKNNEHILSLLALF